MKEIWKDIKGYEGLYQISNLGKIKNIKRKKIRKCNLNDKGYYVLMLSKYLIKKTYRLHRLIAVNFIKNIFDKPCINHKDGNKLNNNINNLEWCTYSENMKHAYKIRLRFPTPPNGENSSLSRLKNKDIKKIRYLRIKYRKKHKELAKQFNTSFGNISLICRNKTWKHI